MTSNSLSRLPQIATLRALALGLAIGFASPVFADNLPEVQRLIKQGQYPQALEKVDTYLLSRPKDAQGRFLKGLILTEMNKPQEAINVFTKLSEDYPELPEPYNNLAVLHAQQKQYEKARIALEMAIRTHPSYAIAYENLGDVYAKLATQAYDKALQLDNSNTVAQNKLALIRDLISTSGNANVKPPQVAAAPAVKSAPTATVVAATPGAASMSGSSMTAATPVANSAPQAAASTPAAVATAPAKTGEDSSGEVAKALAAWASAWSHKDVKSYFAAYSSNFAPPKGLTRKAWEKEREERIAGKPGSISVTYDKPEIRIDGNKATVKIRQHYKAGSLDTSTIKTLIFTRTANRWLIVEENAR